MVVFLSFHFYFEKHFYLFIFYFYLNKKTFLSIYKLLKLINYISFKILFSLLLSLPLSTSSLSSWYHFKSKKDNKKMIIFPKGDEAG